jgi:hypothetical protein
MGSALVILRIFLVPETIALLEAVIKRGVK